MGDVHEEIKVVGIDKETIVMSPSKQDVWIIPFKLSLRPDQDWERKFYDVQKSDTNVMKRTMQIKEDYICVEISQMDDLHKVLDVLRVEVAKTNVLREGDYQKKMKIRQQLEELHLKQGDVTKKFKDDSDQLQF